LVKKHYTSYLQGWSKKTLTHTFGKKVGSKTLFTSHLVKVGLKNTLHITFGVRFNFKKKQFTHQDEQTLYTSHLKFGSKKKHLTHHIW
jgi:hypothetical protein